MQADHSESSERRTGNFTVRAPMHKDEVCEFLLN